MVDDSGQLLRAHEPDKVNNRLLEKEYYGGKIFHACFHEYSYSAVNGLQDPLVIAADIALLRC